jgi:hypothetical protein
LENVLMKRLKENILLDPSVMNLYDIKRIYLLENPLSNMIPIQLEVNNKWPQFLPPITSFSIPVNIIQAVSPGGQNALNVYQVKVRTCSLALVQYIRELVSKKNILFQTKSGFPFLQNACCDEILQYPPKKVLEYFYQDAAIEKMVSMLHNLSIKITDMKRKRKASTIQKELRMPIHLSKDTEKAQKRNIFYSYEPMLFYAVLIHYAHLDSDIYPIPVELERFCNKKPIDMSEDKYSRNASLLEKMHFLEKHHIKMDVTKTIDLMNIIHQRNEIEIIPTMEISYKQKIESALESFQEKNRDIPSLNTYISSWLDKPNYKDMNNSIKAELLSFIGRNLSDKLTLNELNAKTKVLYFYNTEIPLNNLANHMKSLVYRFGIIYPCFLQKESNRKLIPFRWELLPEDVQYIYKNTQTYRKLLEPFVKNTLILPIFENSVERIKPLLDFMNYAILSMENKTIEEYYELALFVIHIIFLTWIGLIDHPDIYKTVTRNIRKNIEIEQEENRIRSNSNSQLMLDENEDILEEVDITSIQIEQKDEIQQCLADLFLVMFSTIQSKVKINAKEPVMMSYVDIMREVDFSKDREKQRLKDRFKKMGTDERKAEIVLKKLHLGDFAVDMKKINQYGKTDLLGDKDEEDEDEEVEAYLIEQEREEFMETRNGDSNLEDQGEEEDIEDINEYAYDNFEEGGYDE